MGFILKRTTGSSHLHARWLDGCGSWAARCQRALRHAERSHSAGVQLPTLRQTLQSFHPHKLDTWHYFSAPELRADSLNPVQLAAPRQTVKMPIIEHLSDSDVERLALERVVPALLSDGFYYVDGLLGALAGDVVLDQVKEMHRSGALQDGRLAGSVPGVHRRSIRGDKTAWVSGSERGCEAINFLLNLIDKLISVCASRLGGKAIRERSKVRVRQQLWCDEVWLKQR